ncbi:uncharacterized protein LOC144445702 [Glandiceps talaboti]
MKLLTLTRSSRNLRSVLQGYTKTQFARRTRQKVQTFQITTFHRATSSLTNNGGILKSNYPDVDIPTNMGLSEFVMENFDKGDDAVALVNSFTNGHYTFHQLKTYVHNCASGLTRAGFQQGDVCALFSPNLPEFFIAYYGVAAIGGINTTVNPLYTADELAQQLEHSETKWIVTIPQFVDKAREAATKLQNIKGIYVFGKDEIEGCIPFTQLMNDDGSAFPSNVKINPNEDVVALPYSSGTTGPPKGVMLTHQSIISNICQLIVPGLFQHDPDTDCVLGLPPFFHIYGMVLLATVMRQRVKHVALPQFDPDNFLKTIQDHNVTCTPVVPPVMLFLAKHPMVDNYDLTSLNDILSAAAPLGADLQDAVQARLDKSRGSLICRQGFGLTELSPVVNLANKHKPLTAGSIGDLVPNTEAKVVDVDSGELLGEGQNGELCYRGPQVMKGYLKNEEATAATVKDGWLHTGDIGHFDSSGQFFIVDRLKELIKYKGFQVAPAELESILLSHSDIVVAAVIGIPDDRCGELPKAFVVSKSKEVQPGDIFDYIEEKVAPHKKLRGGVEFVDEIPKSASGKILRRHLKAQELKKMKDRL